MKRLRRHFATAQLNVLVLKEPFLGLAPLWRCVVGKVAAVARETEQGAAAAPVVAGDCSEKA